mgnify:FL=1
MVKLYSCRAHDGDYFWLRYKHTEEGLYHNLVIDGGRKANASDFCEMLRTIQENGEQVDAVFLTHFDRDHIMGMLAGMQKARRQNCIPEIGKLYLNTGKGYWQHHEGGNEEHGSLPEESVWVPSVDTRCYTAGDLEQLMTFLQSYGLEERLCSYVVQSNEAIWIGGAKLQIISPSEESLEKLVRNGLEPMQGPPTIPYGGTEPEWSITLDELRTRTVLEDTSLSNGASIAFLFTFEEMRIAFLGDAYPSVCVEGLLKLGYSAENPCCVDLVKLPHHGSEHNCSKQLFQLLQTKQYLLSTDGRSGRLPDKIMLAKLLHGCGTAALYCNYDWWQKPIYRTFFTQQDREKWIETGRLRLIKLMSGNAPENVKSGFELYGFGRDW